jgi:hypothetical protein
MKSWLLLAVPDSDRLYRGHVGYSDKLSEVYRFDSSVPNSRRVTVGDLAVMRDKHAVLGTAVVEQINARAGLKQRLRCPGCTSTKLKQRKNKQPSFRCGTCQ